jgi:hypothetical protein
MKMIVKISMSILVWLLVHPANTFAETPNIKIIKVEDLKKENCTRMQEVHKIAKNTVFLVYIKFKDSNSAKLSFGNYQIMKGDNVVKGTPKDNYLIFEFGNPFIGINDTTLNFQVIYIKDLKKPKTTVCQYRFPLDLVTKEEKGKTISNQVDLVELAKDLHFTINLNDLYLDPASCESADNYPSLNGSLAAKIEDYNDQEAKDQKNMLKFFPKNRLIYDAKENEIYWFDEYRKPSTSSLQQHKPFTVRAGSKIAFEIINVNQDSYKLSISDTSVSYFQDPNTMLATYLFPFKTSDGISATATENEKAHERIDTVRAAIVTIDAALNDFLFNQAYACDNLHFKLINNKINAKKRIDQFLMATPLNKSAAVTFNQFMRQELNISKEDSTLYKVTMQLYNALPSVPYHMEYLATAEYNKDRIDFSYSILAREKTPYMNKAINETIPVYITGNFKVDVSTGFFYTRLRNDIYNLRTDSDIVMTGSLADTIPGKRIIDDRRNSGEFGFSSYLHFYKKSRPSFSWGGHIGVGLSLDDQIKPRYFTGLSFLFGRESGRIALNLGIAMGNVDRISNIYTKSDNNPASVYKLTPSSESNVKYVSKFVVAPSIGLSYNIPFSLSKRTQTASTDDPVTKTEITDVKKK